MVAVFVFIVVTVSHFVAVPVIAVLVSVPITSLSVGPASILTVIAVMVICETPVGCEALIIAKARVIAEASFILASPLPIFLLAFTV
jgi:hypothetical protein